MHSSVSSKKKKSCKLPLVILLVRMEDECGISGWEALQNLLSYAWSKKLYIQVLLIHSFISMGNGRGSMTLMWICFFVCVCVCGGLYLCCSYAFHLLISVIQAGHHCAPKNKLFRQAWCQHSLYRLHITGHRGSCLNTEFVQSFSLTQCGVGLHSLPMCARTHTLTHVRIQHIKNLQLKGFSNLFWEIACL